MTVSLPLLPNEPIMTLPTTIRLGRNAYSGVRCEWTDLDSSQQRLLDAAGTGDYDEVVLLLKQNTNNNVNCRDKDGRTPLYWASYFGFVKIVKLLLDNDATIDDRTDVVSLFESSAIRAAVAQDHYEVLELLLLRQNGDMVDCKDIHGRTALHEATAHGHTRIVQLLLENGASVNCAIDYRERRRYIYGGRRHRYSGNWKIPENEDFYGWTCLHCACANGHVDIVELLLDGGAFIQCKDEKGCTPADLALRGNHTNIVEVINQKRLQLRSRAYSWLQLEWKDVIIARHSQHKRRKITQDE